MAPKASNKSATNGPKKSVSIDCSKQKANMQAGSDQQPPQNVVSEQEVKQESAKAAQSAMAMKKKARKLREAANAAGDPEERQKLLEEALDREAEAESFGKLAKYLRTGTFQGMLAGTGLGVMPGVTLGAITGTLVGGVTSEVAGKGIQKITGNLPGWVATDKQKRTLEKMMGQVKDEKMPDEGELTDMMADWDEDAIEPGSWTETAVNIASPFMDEKKNPKEDPVEIRSALMNASKPKPKGQEAQKSDSVRRGPPRQSKGSTQSTQTTQTTSQTSTATPKPSGDDKRQPSGETAQSNGQSTTRKKPRKLESRSHNPNRAPKDTTRSKTEAKENVAPDNPSAAGVEKKKPKKLEVRGK
ncbi:Hypothetical protein R9X50_00347100 [Acrodontium crateriforme]|uniref:Uncharacterized protein n=1 Tax=Acrodontium crateriforme TaxID=150365 RepID=A0AAQ3M676_9PEZI|nr:Hypothetical protein R9X50_00347100 [Acrodontium crateriforme]